MDESIRKVLLARQIEVKPTQSLFWFCF